MFLWCAHQQKDLQPVRGDTAGVNGLAREDTKLSVNIFACNSAHLQPFDFQNLEGHIWTARALLLEAKTLWVRWIPINSVFVRPQSSASPTPPKNIGGHLANFLKSPNIQKLQNVNHLANTMFPVQTFYNAIFWKFTLGFYHMRFYDPTVESQIWGLSHKEYV